METIQQIRRCISTKIGQIGIQLELRLCYYAEQNPRSGYKQTERFFHSSTGVPWNRATVFKLKFNRENIEWKP